MKKFLFAFVLLAVVASCSSSDDPEPLNNTNNGGTTTDNDGGSGSPAVDTAYFYSPNIYYSYPSCDSLYVYYLEDLYAKLVDSSRVYLGNYLLVKRDLEGNVIWRQQVYSEEEVKDLLENGSFLCLCDNGCALFVAFCYDFGDNSADLNPTSLVLNAENGEYIVGGACGWVHMPVLRYGTDSFLVIFRTSIEILNGLTGERESIRKTMDYDRVYDYAGDGYIVSHDFQMNIPVTYTAYGEEDIFSMFSFYITDIYGDDEVYWGGDADYRECKELGIYVEDGNVIYLFSVSDPNIYGMNYPLYEYKVITIAVDGSSKNEYRYGGDYSPWPY